MQITVVIPSKDGLGHLKDCLPSVVLAAQHARADVRVVVVDDRSTDATQTELPILFPTVNVMPNPGVGVVSARNAGVRAFACDWIVFLDNDVFVEPSFFNTLLPYLTPDVFCVACAGYWAYSPDKTNPYQLDGVKLLSYRRGFLRFTENILNKDLPAEQRAACPTFGVQGAYFACNRKYFDELGGFDSLFDPYMLEETDLAYSGLKRGWKIIYAPDTHPLHKCGGTINSKHSNYTQRLSDRNRVLFMWKHIQDFSLLWRHLLWLVLRLHVRETIDCLRLWPAVRAARQREKQAAVLTDAELLQKSRELENRFLRRKSCK